MKRNRHLRLAMVAVAGVLLVASPAGANEIAELKAQIEALQERLARIEAEQRKSADKAVTAGDKAGSWKLPGSDTSVSIGGYVKTDLYLDNRPDSGDTFNAPAIPLDDATASGDEDGNVGIHARQSRLRFDTHTPTGIGALNTRIETDFYGGDSVLRLRHAYGSLGPVLAGQAWSLLVDEDTAASTVDFDGPVGTFAHREPQLRLNLPLGEGFVGQLAVEDSFEGNELPKFLGALRYRSGWGAVNLAGAVGRTDRAGQNVSAHALHLGAHLNVTDATKVMATLNMTRGVKGLIWGGGDGAVMVDGDLKAQDTMGGIAGVSHRWSDSISTGAYFGWVENEAAKGVSAAVRAGSTDDDGNYTAHNKALQTLHANVFWSPAPQANIGLEVMHGWREVHPQVDGSATEGEATRVQIGVQYGF